MLHYGGLMWRDTDYMALALEIADHQLGRTAPNPAVGCVIVKDSEIISQGVTGDGGRPHAEEVALALAGDAARGATVYVTLEPCARRTKTGGVSCSERLVAAGVARVVIAVEDPHGNAGGDGVARLRGAGIEVRLGVLEDEARRAHAGFFSLVEYGRPLVFATRDFGRCDGAFEPEVEETLAAALQRYGDKGMTRLSVEPGSALAAALAAAGFLASE
jgi:diaminohydroxyphosphoribosylaminopyrimidine deaminase/5-amino-6-(5-phosphoribosylamino)uracil reductase